MSTRTALLVGDIVDLRIGTKFSPNKMGNPIELPDRHGGKLVEWNEHNMAVVLWPNGEQYSYGAELLVHTPGANALIVGGDDK